MSAFKLGAGMLSRVVLVAIAVGLLIALKVSVLDSSLPGLLREPVSARFGLGFFSGAMLGFVLGGICGLEVLERYARLKSVIDGLLAGAGVGLALAMITHARPGTEPWWMAGGAVLGAAAGTLMRRRD